MAPQIASIGISLVTALKSAGVVGTLSVLKSILLVVGPGFFFAAFWIACDVAPQIASIGICIACCCCSKCMLFFRNLNVRG